MPTLLRQTTHAANPIRYTDASMQILPQASRATRPGPASYFSGAVTIDEILPLQPSSRMKVNRVTFHDGARTAWHTHPAGQAIHIVSGVAQVQREGEAVKTVNVGDTVWFEPNERHWHGAAPGNDMVHLAMQEIDGNGTDVVWLEHVLP